MENLKIHPEVEELYSELVDIRRQIHMNPELMFDLPLTSSLVENYLRSLDIEVITKVGISGVVGVIKNQGPCILLRADMDCLPLQEANDVPYKSLTPNRMHACGHDAHVAMLLIAAKVLSRRKEKLKGSVKFLFQPAEEGGHGAREMTNDPNYPVLESSPRVDEVYGIHVSNNHNLGDYLLADKYMSCFTIFFSIDVIGKGGHMSTVNNNPVHITSELILAIQTLKSRNLPDSERAVISITSFNAGEAANAVPDTCRIMGTIRVFTKELRDEIHERIKELCTGFEVAKNCKMIIDFFDLYPPIENDQNCNAKALKILQKISTNGKRDVLSPMIGEDFSYFTNKRPGTFFMLGCGTPEKCNPIHSPTFDIDEHAMLIGSSFYVDLILDLLEN